MLNLEERKKYFLNPNPVPYAKWDEELFSRGTRSNLAAREVQIIIGPSSNSGAADLITSQRFDSGIEESKGVNPIDLYGNQINGKIIKENLLEERIEFLTDRIFDSNKKGAEEYKTSLRNYFHKQNENRNDAERIANKWAIKDNLQSILELQYQRNNLERQQQEVERSRNNPEQMRADLVVSQKLHPIAVNPTSSDFLAGNKPKQDTIRADNQEIYLSTPTNKAYQRNIFAAKQDVSKEISHCFSNINQVLKSSTIKEFEPNSTTKAKTENAFLTAADLAKGIINYAGRGIITKTNPIDTSYWRDFTKARNELLLQRIDQIYPGLKSKAFESQIALLKQQIANDLELHKDEPVTIESLKQEFERILNLISEHSKNFDEDHKKFIERLNESLTNSNQQFLDDLDPHVKDNDRLWKYRVFQVVLLMAPFSPFSLISPMLGLLEPFIDGTKNMAQLVSSFATPEITKFFGEITQALQIDKALDWIIDVPLDPISSTADAIFHNEIVGSVLPDLFNAANGSPLTDIGAAGLFLVIYGSQELERIEKLGRFLDDKKEGLKELIKSKAEAQKKEVDNAIKNFGEEKFALEKKLTCASDLSKWIANNYYVCNPDFNNLTPETRELLRLGKYKEFSDFVYDNFEKPNKDISELLLIKQKATNPKLIAGEMAILDDSAKSDSEKQMAKNRAIKDAYQEQKEESERRFIYSKCYKFGKDPRNIIESTNDDYLKNKYGDEIINGLSEEDKKILRQKEVIILATGTKDYKIGEDRFASWLNSESETIIPKDLTTDLIGHKQKTSTEKQDVIQLTEYNGEQKAKIETGYRELLKEIEKKEPERLQTLERKLLELEISTLSRDLIRGPTPSPRQPIDASILEEKVTTMGILG